MAGLLSGSQVLDMIARSHMGARANGFWEADRNFSEMLALVHSEVSEAYDAFSRSPSGFDDHLPKRIQWQVEIADAFIRLADMVGGLSCHVYEEPGEPEDEASAIPVRAYANFKFGDMPRQDVLAQLVTAFDGIDTSAAIALEAAFDVPPRTSIYEAAGIYDFVVQRMSRLRQMSASLRDEKPSHVVGLPEEYQFFLDIHAGLSAVLERYRKPPKDRTYNVALDLLLLMARIDAGQRALFPTWFDTLINEKLDYNKSRGYKHGKKF